MGSADVPVDHYVSWHTRDSVTGDLRGELTPVVHSLVHDAIVLTVSTLGSGAATCLTEIDDGLHRVLGVDLNLVEDGVGAHGCPPLTMNIVWHKKTPSGGAGGQFSSWFADGSIKEFHLITFLQCMNDNVIV
jgi:hypothetical protein